MTPPAPLSTPGPVWLQIRTTLADEIARGRYRPGDRLPTEAALATRFGVNRHTVRRALADLTEAGTIYVRRGAGAFVAARPAPYPIGPRTRFTENIASAGRRGSRHILRLETLPADARQAAALGLEPDQPVHVLHRVSMLDGWPASYTESCLPAACLPGFPGAIRAQESITVALRRCGVTDYTRAWTRLSAEPARGAVARHLHLPEGRPLLRAVSLNVDTAQRPVEYAITWFCTDRLEIVVTPDSLRAMTDPAPPEGRAAVMKASPCSVSGGASDKDSLR